MAGFNEKQLACLKCNGNVKGEKNGKRDPVSVLQHARRTGQGASHRKRWHNMVYPEGYGTAVWGG
jgi:hypothetical protein